VLSNSNFFSHLGLISFKPGYQQPHRHFSQRLCILGLWIHLIHMGNP
jgi:hypothetical protein